MNSNICVRSLAALCVLLVPALSHAHTGNAATFQLGFLHAAFSVHHLLIPFSAACLIGALLVTAPRWKAALVCASSLGMGGFALV